MARGLGHPVRVVCCYAADATYDPNKAGHGRHNNTLVLLDAIAPGWERHPIRQAETNAYFGVFRELFAEKAHFLNVEHDIELRLDVIAQLNECPEPWCVFPYEGPCQGELLYESLGCTRFRTEMFPDTIMTEVQETVDGLGARDWRRLDMHLSARLKWHGFSPCHHYPVVVHHHRYAHGCSCGKEHGA